MKSIPSLFATIFSSLTAIIQLSANAEMSGLSYKGFRIQRRTNSPQRLNELLKILFRNKPAYSSTEGQSGSSPFRDFQFNHEFKGCVDPSESFQCPHSEQCTVLQLICNGYPYDCPDNLDENEKTCIAAKRPATENIEKFLLDEYRLRGIKIFTFLFGETNSRNIQENHVLWTDILASTFSISKTTRDFARKTNMSSNDRTHFQDSIQLIYDGRLEEIPLLVQEELHYGLASLTENLYESGFMGQ